MDLHYETQGQGEAIVLLHSGGADLRDWELVIPQLAVSYRCIAFDGRVQGSHHRRLKLPIMWRI